MTHGLYNGFAMFEFATYIFVLLPIVKVQNLHPPLKGQAEKNEKYYISKDLYLDQLREYFQWFIESLQKEICSKFVAK